MELDSTAIAKFCQKHHITKLMRYINPLRDHCRTEGDIDLIVSFERGHDPGYIRLAGMEQELALILGFEQVYLDGTDCDSLLFPSKALSNAIAVAEPFYPA